VASDPGREPATQIKAEKKPLATDRMRESLAAMKADRRWTFGQDSSFPGGRLSFGDFQNGLMAFIQQALLHWTIPTLRPTLKEFSRSQLVPEFFIL
jgi:hypothetical protein